MFSPVGPSLRNPSRRRVRTCMLPQTRARAQQRPNPARPNPARPKGFGPPNAGRHTLMLMQKKPAASSKTWADYTNINAAVDGFINSFESEFRSMNPGMKTLTYSVADLQKYVDSMHDVSMLVSDPQTKQYAPKGKAFIKNSIMQRLKSSVA